MKTVLTFLIIITGAILFTGCSKSTDITETREEKVVKLLTGSGNKVWHLSSISIGGVDQVLTDFQRKYTKTYTIDPTNSDPISPKKGTVVTGDGYTGTWRMKDNGGEFTETFTNNPSGPVPVTYIINKISETLLDIEYTMNMRTQREVYYAY